MKIVKSVHNSYTLLLIIFLSGTITVFGQEKNIKILTEEDITFGADQFIKDSLMWQNRKIALVVNQTSVLSNGQHLVDALYAKGADVAWIYAPEHGFRGEADRGASVKDGIDPKTAIPIKSLYGENKKPIIKDLKLLDLLIFDIQDVGTRFYTYLSTMYNIMEVAAKANTPIIVLDRPNPNGFYVDGPVLDTAYRSFVGIIPIPIVHGMTLGELAHLIVGEELIENVDQLPLKVYSCVGYDHRSTYELPIKPSPNLPNLRSILLYPSLCYFEATNCSVGRGTEQQFQLIGSPYLKEKYQFEFTPISMSGATHPKFEGQSCYGLDLSKLSIDTLLESDSIQWNYFFYIHNNFEGKEFISREPFLNLLMGTNQWKVYLNYNDHEGWKDSYQQKLNEFKHKRKKYLLYPE